jgi:hypothetical protein
MGDFDPTDLRGQERARERRERRTRIASDLEAEDFKWLMSDKRGRRIVHSWLTKAGVWRSSFTGNSETFFREGQRNVGLMLLDQINSYCPERYATMLKEHKDDVRRNAGNE